MLAIGLSYFINRAKIISFKNLPIVGKGRLFVVCISMGFVLFLFVWYLIRGVDLNFDLTKVYQFRYRNAEIASFGVLSYTNNWTYKVFNVTLFAFALLNRRYFIAFILFLFQFFFFAASAHKGVLFLPVLVLCTWYYFRKTDSTVVIPVLFSAVIGLTIFFYFVFDDLLSSSLFSRRVFFVPASLTFTYFEFFETNPTILWSNSILSSIVDYPYEGSMSQVIGRFLGQEGMAANNGFVSSGYAHAGLLGVFFYAVLIGLVLRLIDDMSFNKLPLWFAISLCVVPIRSVLISSDLFTVMLTHGFLLVLLIIFFVRERKA